MLKLLAEGGRIDSATPAASRRRRHAAEQGYACQPVRHKMMLEQHCLRWQHSKFDTCCRARAYTMPDSCQRAMQRYAGFMCSCRAMDLRTPVDFRLDQPPPVILPASTPCQAKIHHLEQYLPPQVGQQTHSVPAAMRKSRPGSVSLRRGHRAVRIGSQSE